MGTKGKKNRGLFLYDMDIRPILESMIRDEILYGEAFARVTDVQVSPGPSPDSISVRCNVPRPLDNIQTSFIVDDIEDD